MAKLTKEQLKYNLNLLHSEVKQLREKHPDKKYKELLKMAAANTKSQMKKST